MSQGEAFGKSYLINKQWGIAQLAEQRAVNSKVPGSSPGTPADPYPSITQRYFTGQGFISTKCYGSTAVSKTAGLGSIPRVGANKEREL